MWRSLQSATYSKVRSLRYGGPYAVARIPHRNYRIVSYHSTLNATSPVNTSTVIPSRPFSSSSTTTTTTRTLSTPSAAVYNSEGVEWHGQWRNDTNGQEFPIVFLHGLLGNSRNIQTMAQQLCQQTHRPGFLIDIRGHGKSKLVRQNENHNSATTLMQECVVDIHATLQSQGIVSNSSSSECAMVGHSLGGRLILEYAATAVATSSLVPAPHVSQIWLLDTVPGHANRSVEFVLSVAHEIQSAPTPWSRPQLIQFLQYEYKLDGATAQWLASSYNTQQHAFAFDLHVAQQFVPALQQQDFHGLLHQVLTAPRTVQVHIVRGGRNPDWETSWSGLEAMANEYSNLMLHTLPQAGHWVHVDDLPGLLKAMHHVKPRAVTSSSS
jgi:pimeloyl-ACP methyl ester carboxylesterase